MPILEDIIKNENKEEIPASINFNNNDIKNNISEVKKENDEDDYENEKFEGMNITFIYLCKIFNKYYIK